MLNVFTERRRPTVRSMHCIIVLNPNIIFRSMLAPVLLSYVERLEPDYVIIENVVGFVEHKATLQDGRQVAAAMVKIVARIGLALGYAFTPLSHVGVLT